MAENGLTRKIGPLPAWAWGILGGIAVYFLYTRYRNSSTTAVANSPTASVLDPNAVDPTTGLTYGQELSGGFPTSGNLQASTGSGVTTGSGLSPIDALDQELASFLQAQQDFGQVAGALGFQPPNPSATTVAAAASPPVQNTSPPPAKPPPNPGLTLHSALLSPQGVSGGSAQAFLGGILSGKQPYSKVKGSTQKGGLPQTGTYTKKGGPTYFVFSQGGALHVRQAK